MKLAKVSTSHIQAVTGTTQLPRNVRPTHYDVAVVPNAEKLQARINQRQNR